MNVSSISSAGGLMGSVSRSFAVSQMKGDFSTGGLLTNSDIALIKAATNTEFNWPPAAGEGAPLAAFELSLVRLRQMQQGSVIADFTAKDLAALRRAGLINADFFTNAIDYLRRGGRDDDKASSASSRVPPTDLTHATGTVAKDRSIYL